MASRGGNEFVVCREGNRHETTVVVNLPFGKLGSGGRVERLDFTAFGHGEELSVRRPDNRRDGRLLWYLVIEFNELVSIFAVENSDVVFLSQSG